MIVAYLYCFFFSTGACIKRLLNPSMTHGQRAQDAQNIWYVPLDFVLRETFSVKLMCVYETLYEGVSKSSRKSAIIFLFCKSGELN